jgi:hypothetical protein
MSNHLGLIQKNLVLIISLVAQLSFAATEQTMKESPIEGTAEGPPESSKKWQYPHTSQRARFGLIAGDQGPGPIRYNTQFPEVKGNPHPASYYHGAANLGAELEFSLKTGALLLGGISRYDLWHSGIKSRTLTRDSVTWRVDRFDFNDSAVVFGWILGDRFREATWSADLALVYDTGSITANMIRIDSGEESEARIGIQAISMRARVLARIYGLSAFIFAAGPEIHLPVWYHVSDRSDSTVKSWVADSLDLRASASIGYVLAISLAI